MTATDIQGGDDSFNGEERVACSAEARISACDGDFRVSEKVVVFVADRPRSTRVRVRENSESTCKNGCLHQLPQEL